MTESEERRRGMWICLGLAAAAVLVYWPVHGFGFVNFDDPDYVAENRHVQGGLTIKGLVWALTTNHATNWHPLTWLSHMLDCQIYGLKAGGHHLTNLLLHLANTLLLFGVLKRLTGALWRSALVAALFGLHPLHVESVAWVAERKDVLSTLFWLLTLWAYSRHVEKYEERRGKSGGSADESRHRLFSSLVTRHSSLYYGLALVFFVLGLMAKPMLVTLPFVLLLLDYWPLRRFGLSTLNPEPATLSRLAREKMPFFVLAAASSVVTYWAQERGGSVMGWEVLPLGERVGNALVSYVRYVGMAAWPSGLAVFYPYRSWPVWGVILAGLMLVGVTVFAVRRLGREPWFGVGWLWYLGTLVPVIGLVQVGRQALADRYTYVPLIGLFIVGVWGTAAVLAGRRWAPRISAVLSGAVLIGCLGGTWFQVRHWRNGITLFEHALAVTRGNYVAHDNLGTELVRAGRVAEASGHYERALAIKPDYAKAHNNLGVVLFRLGRVAEAIAHYEHALRITPNCAEVHNNLGAVLLEQGRVPEAASHYELALRFKPDYADAHYNLGKTLLRQDQVAAALRHLEQARQLAPEDAEVRVALAVALLQQGRMPEAIGHLEQALRLEPGDVDAHHNLGTVRLQQGQLAEAIAHFEAVLRLKPEDAQARDRLATARLQLDKELSAQPGSRLEDDRPGRAQSEIPRGAVP